jgi:large subunit ribosomal protein L3
MTFVVLDAPLSRLLPCLRERVKRTVSKEYQSFRALKNPSNKQIPVRTGVLAIKKSVAFEDVSDELFRGMTAVWDDKGNRLPVTMLQLTRAQVISVKTLSKHGYWAVQVGIGLRRPENVTKAMLGHFAAARVAPKMHVGEFRVRDKSGLLPIGTIDIEGWG